MRVRTKPAAKVVTSRLQPSIEEILASGGIIPDIMKPFRGRPRYAPLTPEQRAKAWKPKRSGRTRQKKVVELEPIVPQPSKGPRLRMKRAPARDSTDQELEFALRQKAAEARAKLLELCRTDVDTFVEYVMRDDKTGDRIEQSPFHLQLQRELTQFQQMVTMSHPDSGKALALDTEIPTPNGWSTMGALQVGDRVFDSQGRPCNVTFTTGIQLNRKVFEVEFEDGAVLKADADHRWLVRKRQSLGTTVVTTADMLARLRENDGHYTWSVPVTRPVQHVRHRLLLRPYVLGAWLGNGSSQNAALCFFEPDRFVWDQCVGFVGGHMPRRDSRNPRVLSGTLGTDAGVVRGKLRRLGVLQNKHIPSCYLQAAEVDRRELLAGLLDTDGYVDPKTGRVELTFCNERLSTDALELVRSLGYRATMAQSDAKLNGRVVGQRWRIAFTAGEPVFRLPRKRDSQRLATERCRWKHVVAIREMRSVPVRCISVDSPDRTYLAGRSYTVTHNTNQLIGRLLFKLGKNPNLRAMWLCNSEDSAMKTLATVRRYIESSTQLHEVFPALKKGDTWKDDSIVIARTAYSRDPTVVAVGYNSKRIQGSRVDFLIVDDLLDAQVTATESQRRKLSSWMKNTVFTRLTDGAEVAFLTNAWHPRDFAHELVKERGWHLLRRPIRNADGKIWWHRWTEQRLALMKKSLGPLEYARSYECDPRDDGSRVFRPEHVEYAKTRGEGYGFIHDLDIMPDDCIVVTGIDLAAAAQDVKTRGARTAITSVFFHRNQTRQVVRMRSGRWRASQILQEICAVGQVFPRNHWIVVESNAVQRWIIDLASQQGDMDVGVPLVPFHTGRNKMDPQFGVASMAAEFEGRRWVLPASCFTTEEQEEVEALMAEMIDYVPEAHTGDRLMSLWFAREIGRRIFAKFFGLGGGSDRRAGSVVRAIG